VVVHTCNPSTGEAKEEDHGFEASLGYLVREKHAGRQSRKPNFQVCVPGLTNCDPEEITSLCLSVFICKIITTSYGSCKDEKSFTCKMLPQCLKPKKALKKGNPKW
jgi:hypothetical protein